MANMTKLSTFVFLGLASASLLSANPTAESNSYAAATPAAPSMSADEQKYAGSLNANAKAMFMAADSETRKACMKMCAEGKMDPNKCVEACCGKMSK